MLGNLSRFTTELRIRMYVCVQYVADEHNQLRTKVRTYYSVDQVTTVKVIICTGRALATATV